MIDFLKRGNNGIFFGLIVLTILNLIQSFSTELLSDEAYYWVYRQYMDWGYFDHPPMIAVWNYISSLFFSSGELSVRFFSAFSFSATIYLVWQLIDHPKKKDYIGLFWLIVLSTVLFNAYGFVTVPDTPLLFFMALFLLGYKKYLKFQDWLSYTLIAIAMAGMLYSKYQGVLIIFFVLLSNFKIVKDYKIWIATLGATILFFPHLYWQFANDYPTFRYHLFERSATSSYKLEDTLLHFLNIIVIIGLTFPIVYKALFKNLKNKDTFNKGVNYVAIGFPIFFFLMSFKGHVQAQWIAPILIPLIIITFNYLIKVPKNKNLFSILALITISITFVIRFLLANDVLPFQLDFHGNKAWVERLDKTLEGRKPIFKDSYQNASTYWFYSGKAPCEYNSWWSRKNHFDLIEHNNFCGDGNAVLIGKKDLKPTADTTITKRGNGKMYIKYLNNYSNRKGLKISFEENIVLKEKNKLKVNVLNPYSNFKASDITVKITFRNDKNKFIEMINAELSFPKTILKGDNIALLEFNLPENLKKERITKLQVVGQSHPDITPFRLSKIERVNSLD